MATRVQDIIAAGTIASRPAASSSNIGYLYIATDENGGTEYRSNGSTWDQTGGSVNTIGMTPGGTTGQVLTKTSGADYATDWETPATTHSVPAGGTTGQVLTKTSGADYATDWETPSGGGGGTPVLVGARRYPSGATSIPGATEVALPLASSVFDTDGFWDAGNPTRLAVPSGKDGYYQITGHIAFETPTAGDLEVYIRVNGGTVISGVAVPPVAYGGDWTRVEASGIWHLTAGDFIEISGYTEGAGGTIAAGGSSGTSWLSMFLVGT